MYILYTYYPQCMTPLDPSKPSILIKLGPFGHGQTSGDMVGRCMPNSGPGGCPVGRQRENEEEWKGRGERRRGRKREREEWRRERESGRGGGAWICPIYPIHLHIPSYTFIYFHIPSYTSKYPQILLYTFIYPHILQISNKRKMRANVKHKNGHNSEPRASPRLRHKASYHVSRGFGTPNGPPN